MTDNIQPNASGPLDFAERTPEVRLAEFIAAAKSSPALPGIVWSDWTWTLADNDSTKRLSRSHKSPVKLLTFSNRDSSAGKGAGRRAVKYPMSEPYLSFAKADVRLTAQHRDVSGTVLAQRIAGHRLLEKVLQMSGGVRGVTEICREDFDRAEFLVKQELQGKNRYRTANVLVDIARVIDKWGLTSRRVNYAHSLDRPLDGDELTSEGQRAGEEKMISGAALQRLSELSANPPTDEGLLFIRMLDLLVAGGFRIGELLTLPADCWIEGPEITVNPATGKRDRTYGITYAAEKARDFRTKWLPSAAVELARRALDDLERLCRPGRTAAAWMDAHPGRIRPLAEFDPDAWIPGEKAAELLGLAPRSHKNWKLMRRRGDDPAVSVCYRVHDIEEYYLGQVRTHTVLRMPSGHTQKLSESLLVAFVNQFHGQRTTLSFLPQPITVGDLQDAVSPPLSHQDRANALLGPQHRVTSHQFRHWINTLAANGGLSDVELAKWMGRRDITQNVAYKHGTLVQRTQAAKDLICAGKAHGRIARVAATMSEAERAKFLDGAITAVHTTALGLCAHDYAASPCTEHHQCLRGCGDYLRVAGDAEQRATLLDLEKKEMAALESHQRALADNFYGAERWIIASKQHLEGIRAALAVDASDSPPRAGAHVRVFPKAQSKQMELL